MQDTKRPDGDMPATVAIIGAGPAGLIAAETLAEAGLSVAVYDRMPSPGRKLLMAGRGGLNLTHSEDLARFLTRYGTAMERLTSCIEAFPPSALRAWCGALGQPTFVGSSGRVFPKALKASPLLRAWLLRLDRQGAKLLTRHNWIGWDASGALQFERPDGSIATARPRVTVLALGGASWPKLGATGAWVEILSRRGIAIAPLAPANCGFAVRWTERFRTRFAGQPLKHAAFSHAGQTVRGEAMVTDYGIEGGAIYALSAGVRETIAREGRTVLTIDLRPDVTAAELTRRLIKAGTRQSLSNVLRKAAGLAPIAVNLLYEVAGGPPTRHAGQLAASIKALPIALLAPQPLARAISTAGGVRFDQLDPGFMVRALPGVFVAGEMLDWEAPTGGYLLQACFATGIAVARGAIAWLAERANISATAAQSRSIGRTERE